MDPLDERVVWSNVRTQRHDAWTRSETRDVALCCTGRRADGRSGGQAEGGSKVGAPSNLGHRWYSRRQGQCFMHRPFYGEISRHQPSKCLRKNCTSERRNLANLASGRGWKASIGSKGRAHKCKSMLAGLGAVNQDAASFAFTAVAALSFVTFFDKLAEWDIFDSKTSRKLLHLSTGPLFVLCWPFYSSHPNAKFVAMLTPVLNLIRLLLIGSGLVDGKFAVKAASRSGDRFELLRGPMYYVITLIFVTFLWRDSPLSMLIMSTVCVGDGLADLVGRKFGRDVKLPYNKDKSVAGSAAMFLFGSISCILFLALFQYLNYFSLSTPQLITSSVGVAFGAALVESLPITKFVDDNISVPIVSLILGKVLLHL